MRIGTAIAVMTMTGLVNLVTANIQGIAVPQTIKPGDQFDAVFICNDNSQPADEVAAAFGLAPRNSTTTSLGTVLGSVYIGPEKSNLVHKNFSFPLTVPPTEHTRAVALVRALFRVDSNKSLPKTELSRVNVAIGNKTSDEYVSSYTFMGQH